MREPDVRLQAPPVADYYFTDYVRVWVKASYVTTWQIPHMPKHGETNPPHKADFWVRQIRYIRRILLEMTRMSLEAAGQNQ
jgi:hypothetical protein